MDKRKADRRIETVEEQVKIVKKQVKPLYPGEETIVESDGSNESMDHWLYEMAQSDVDMPRAQEDLLTHLIEDHGYGVLIHPMLKAKYDEKKKLRAKSPR